MAREGVVGSLPILLRRSTDESGGVPEPAYTPARLPDCLWPACLKVGPLGGCGGGGGGSGGGVVMVVVVGEEGCTQRRAHLPRSDLRSFAASSPRCRCRS